MSNPTDLIVNVVKGSESDRLLLLLLGAQPGVTKCP